MSLSSLSRNLLALIFLSRKYLSSSKQDLFLPLRVFSLMEKKIHPGTWRSLLWELKITFNNVFTTCTRQSWMIYFDTVFSFLHQLFEEDFELNNVQSSAIVGRLFKKSHRFNASKISFETSSKPFQSLNSKCSASKHSSSSPFSKRSHYTKIPVVSTSHASKISLQPQTPPHSSYPAHSAPI